MSASAMQGRHNQHWSRKCTVDNVWDVCRTSVYYHDRHQDHECDGKRQYTTM